MLKEARNESLPSSNEEEQKYDLEAVAERADSEELDSDDLDEEEEFDFSNEDDEDLDVEDQRQDQEVPPDELIGSLKSYMSEMDRELAHTNGGKSFPVQKRGASSVNATTSQSAGPDDTELIPVDVDQNLVANLIKSYSAQSGLAGPTSNILQSTGVCLPENADHIGSNNRATE
ncbi:protein ecdysoneless homolog isoform X2 [Tyto alba]|uniref:protein ecdysoneless homolog isoform X2 n=1 Tax=Tyto alba TaxID=56313 RepID=UPI001C67883A|nr:protein ecdysoneless homolog isoform X2 [Tyto alba]